MDGCAFVGHRREGKTESMFRDSPCGKDPTAVDLFSYPWSVRKCSLRPWNLLLGKSLRRLFPSATLWLCRMRCQAAVLGHHVLHKEGFSFNRNWTGDLSSSDQ